MCKKRFVKGSSAPHQFYVDHWEQVSEINRLQLHVQQLEQQHVRHQDQVVLGHQHRSLAHKDFTPLSGSILNGSCLSATLSIVHSGYNQLCARAAYCTSISVAAMRYPRLSLQAVAAAANLVHERAAIRKNRMAALAVVDLCSAGSFKDCCVKNEGVSVSVHGRCLQVLSLFTLSILLTSFKNFHVAGHTQSEDFGKQTGVTQCTYSRNLCSCTPARLVVC
jgi:hypothetical protein